MDKDKILAELYIWIENFLEKPNKAFGGWTPCPYIRNSRLNNKLHIVFIDNVTINNDINNNLNQLATKDCVVFLFNHNEINFCEADNIVIDFNNNMMKNNYVIIMDHPDNPEDINGENINFGKCGILLLFKLDYLNKLANTLKKKGYFDFWPKGSYEQRIAWRYTSDLTKNK